MAVAQEKFPIMKQRLTRFWEVISGQRAARLHEAKRKRYVAFLNRMVRRATKYRDDSTGAEWVRWHNLVWMIETKISRVR